MSDDLRTRIAAVVYRHILFRALDQCECGASFDGFCGRSLDAYAAHVADAVIRELGCRQEAAFDRQSWKLLRHRYVTKWTAVDTPYCNRCGIPHNNPCLRETHQ